MAIGRSTGLFLTFISVKKKVGERYRVRINFGSLLPWVLS
jgi:hypothetical protein